MKWRRFSIGVLLAIGVTLTVIVPGDGGWLSYEKAQFRIVRKGGRYFAFDRGERPDIDGYSFRDPDAARVKREQWRRSGVRTTLQQRHEDQGEADLTKAPFDEIAGSIEEERRGFLIAGRSFYVPWLDRGQITLCQIDGRTHNPDGSVTGIPVGSSDFMAAREEVGRYLEVRYPSTRFGDEVSSGLGDFVQVRPGWTSVIAIQATFLIAALILIISSFRPYPRTPPRVR
jgi:hypothetical protein